GQRAIEYTIQPESVSPRISYVSCRGSEYTSYLHVKQVVTRPSGCVPFELRFERLHEWMALHPGRPTGSDLPHGR
ncbi:hypothetical protein M404DRAFT_1003902, partial [Pisolithus tinctorius Marx 270]